MNRIGVARDALRLMRVHNCLIGAFSVVVGSVIGGGAPGIATTGAIATFLAAAGGYILNDLFDVEIDRLVKPWRPLASGFNRRVAWMLLIVFWSVGLLVAIFDSLILTIFYLSWVGMLTAYTSAIKGMGVVGNLVSSSVSASGLLLGGFLAGHPQTTLIPFVLAFLLHMMREIIKSIADYRGDSKFDVRTVAVRWGVARCVGLVIAIGIMLMVLGIVPFAINQFGIFYLVVVVVGVYPLLFLAVVRLWQSKQSVEIEKSAMTASMLLKWAMPMGLVAFIAGRFV